MSSSRWPHLNSAGERRLVTVVVKTEAREETVVERAPARLVIAVRQKAAYSAANRRVIELVARHYEVPENVVRIIKGHTTPNKILEITNTANRK